MNRGRFWMIFLGLLTLAVIVLGIRLIDPAKVQEVVQEQESGSDLSSTRITAISTDRITDAAGYGWKPGISYAFSADGGVWKWGYDNPLLDHPKRIETSFTIRQISGDFVLSDDGHVWRSDQEKNWHKEKALSDVIAIQQIEMHGTLFALKRDGTVWKVEREGPVPTQMTQFRKINVIHGTSFSLYLIDEEGRLSYLNGKMGVWDTEAAKDISIPGKVELVSANADDLALIQTVNDEVFTFFPDDHRVVRTPSADGAKRLAVGDKGLFLFVRPDGTIWGWGSNESGLLGSNHPEQVESPVQVPGLMDIVDLQLGNHHALALDKNGQVFSWGNNMTGQLGRLPVMFKEWKEIGQLDGIEQVITELDRPYFLKSDGSLWEIEDDYSMVEKKGMSAIRTLTSVYRVPITLSEEGKICIWTDGFTSFQDLELPFHVKKILGGEGRLFVQTTEDQLAVVQLEPIYDHPEKPEWIREMGISNIHVLEEESDRVLQFKSFHVNHYAFLALTQDGRVFYLPLQNKLPTAFTEVKGLPAIQELSAAYYVGATLDPASVLALDRQGVVHEILMESLDGEGSNDRVIQSKLLLSQEENMASVSGRLRITKEGHIFEKDWSPEPKTIPQPVRLLSSSYNYWIEGPGSHYHVLVTEDDRIALIGYNPFGKQSNHPGKVKFE